MMKKIMLLGSGELGKEFVIAAKRMGEYVIAVDSYDDAPAMQVADTREVIDMLDGKRLDFIVEKHKPDIIVPEIEAIRTERFYEYEKNGIQIVPSAKAADYTMNRKAIRDLAAKELGVKTANYRYADTLEGMHAAVEEVGIPCVIKPLMSSSGKGQTIIKTVDDIENSWEIGITKGRGDKNEVIVESFIDFEIEITLMTVTQKNGPTLYCPPIGHRQERGDYQESWQPADVSDSQLKEAQYIADKITRSLTGFGIWGVEFFMARDGVYFSELSPRPHDTGMVTLAGSQTWSEFDLHLRAMLGLPIPELKLERAAASAVILADKESHSIPEYEGLEEAAAYPNSNIRIFGKPFTREYRRMGVALTYDKVGSSTEALRQKAAEIAGKIKVR
ncbi:MAG: formate-dependent phosphoribosylglycinamide formyltransferase [Bacteroidetes bacterium]|nr:formate-dependent phosphoribosylglycinamide formyltransferase [Bacteroidota bacterium]